MLGKLKAKYQQEGVSFELLSEIRTCWEKIKSQSVALNSVPQEQLCEEFGVLHTIVKLELNGHKPRMLTHSEFATVDIRSFTEMFIGDLGVIVISAEN